MSSRLPLHSSIERAVAGEQKGRYRVQIAVHVGFVVCALGFVLLHINDYISLATTWAKTGTFQYAFLIFPISAALIWSRRDWLTRVSAQPRPWALWALALIGALWLAGVVSEINLARHVAMVVIWPVLVYLFYGPRVGRVLAFALGYLLFAIPFGDFMVGPLQTVTAHLAVYALHLTGVPVLMDGHFIDTPVSAWHVAEACSGIKFFIATTSFAVLYAHVFYTSLRRRLIFVACGMVVPIIANGLRVYFTILIGEYLGLQYATGTDHMVFGWQFFGTVLLLLFLAGWPWHEPPSRAPVRAAGALEDGSRSARWLAPVTLMLIVLPVAWYLAAGQLSARAGSTVAALPAQLADSSALAGAGAAHVPSVSGMDVNLSRRYVYKSRVTQVVYLGNRSGHDGADVTNMLRRVYGPQHWSIQSVPGLVRVNTSGPGFRKVLLRSKDGGGSRKLLYAYRIGASWTVSPWRLKFRQSVDRLLGRPDATGILLVSSVGNSRDEDLVSVAAAAARVLR